MGEKKTIELKYPLTITSSIKDEKGNTRPMESSVSVLSLGRIKAKHLKLIPKEVFEQAEGKAANISPHTLLPLIAGVAGLPIESIEEMDFSDLSVVITAVVALVEESLSQ